MNPFVKLPLMDVNGGPTTREASLRMSMISSIMDHADYTDRCHVYMSGEHAPYLVAMSRSKLVELIYNTEPPMPVTVVES